MTSSHTRNRRILAIICLAWTLGITALLVSGSDYEHAELRSGDWLTVPSNSSARQAATNPQLLYLGIDNATKTLDTVFPEEVEQSRALQLIKQDGYPFNREVYALIIDRLAAAGAKAIVLDVLFEQKGSDDEDPARNTANSKLREALLRHRNRVVIGSNFVDAKNSDNRYGGFSRSYFLPEPALLSPGPDSWVGFVNCWPDEDGLIRRFTYRTMLSEQSRLPSPPGEQAVLSLPARALEKAGRSELIPAGKSAMRIRPSKDLQPLSLHEIFVDAQWNSPTYEKGALFKDKIVVIGAAGNQAEDRLQTPSGTTMGPLLHLNATNAALNDDFIYETYGWQNLALLAAAGLTAWVLGAGVTHRTLRLLLLALLLGGYYAAAQFLYNSVGLLPLLLSPMLILGGSGITWTVFEQALDLRERQRVRRNFEKYVSPDVVREILDNPTTFLNSLGGERRDVTILFSDIRGFTTLTEKTDPQILVMQLNEYFKEMVAIVFSHEGSLDKFIGDAVMAHWGSLGTAGEALDARHAVQAALKMRTALVGLNVDWQARGLPEFHIGVGINHGSAIAGNIGAAGDFERFDFTVLGDAVNLASRLEGVTKDYGIDLCVGEDVEALVRDAFVLRSVDYIVVQGKTRPARVFTVLEERTAETVEPPWLAHHERAMRAYRAGDFATAETSWLEVIAVQPDDPLSPIFLARCAQLIANPPGQNWTGVFTMQHK